MNQVRLRQWVSILLVLLVAVVVLAVQPVQAGSSNRILGRILNNQGSEYEAGFATEPGSGSYEGQGGCRGDRFTEEGASGTQTVTGDGTVSTNPPSVPAMLYTVPEGTRPLSATLSGAAEVPGPGDPDGGGKIFITQSQGQGLLCWAITTSEIVSPTAAHIHAGIAGIAGPLVVTLSPPEDGSSVGCVSVERKLFMEIRKDPSAFYVNVHTAEFPSGAMRGQLSK